MIKARIVNARYASIDDFAAWMTVFVNHVVRPVWIVDCDEPERKAWFHVWDLLRTHVLLESCLQHEAAVVQFFKTAYEDCKDGTPFFSNDAIEALLTFAVPGWFRDRFVDD
jgi:hypothetical protein